MSKKKQLLWSNLMWGSIAEIILYGSFILLVSLLAVQGKIAIQRCSLLLSVGALTATMIAGMIWGRKTPVKGWGCILCSVIFIVILLFGNLSFEEEISAQAIPIVLCALLGGVVSTVLTGKKKHGARKRKKVNL